DSVGAAGGHGGQECAWLATRFRFVLESHHALPDCQPHRMHDEIVDQKTKHTPSPRPRNKEAKVAAAMHRFQALLHMPWATPKQAAVPHPFLRRGLSDRHIHPLRAKSPCTQFPPLCTRTPARPCAAAEASDTSRCNF
ncbi:hypothetical protein H4R24_005723, partial [Coemansia sp. RSA 988]